MNDIIVYMVAVNPDDLEERNDTQLILNGKPLGLPNRKYSDKYTFLEDAGKLWDEATEAFFADSTNKEN